MVSLNDGQTIGWVDQCWMIGRTDGLMDVWDNGWKSIPKSYSRHCDFSRSSRIPVNKHDFLFPPPDRHTSAASQTHNSTQKHTKTSTTLCHKHAYTHTHTLDVFCFFLKLMRLFFLTSVSLRCMLLCADWAPSSCLDSNRIKCHHLYSYSAWGEREQCTLYSTLMHIRHGPFL